MIQRIGKMLTIFIFFFSLLSNLYAAPCADWNLLLPPARDGAAMAFDSTTNQTILFGGFSNGQLLHDTWSWDGAKWTQLFPATSPPSRSDGTMAFDPTTNQIILFGGFSGTGNVADTWSWDGSNWTQLTPADSPSARAGARMAFDSINNLLILFGGFSGSVVVNDTWNWNGTNWVQLLDGSTNSPPGRADFTMAFGPTIDQMIVFGGFGPVTFLNDTWSWDGATTTWIELNNGSTGSPPVRDNAVMGYDPVTNQNILFGGRNTSGDLGDTWSWDGTAWTGPLTLTTSPSARDTASFALDANNNLILFGGINGNLFGDTWSWDGTEWTLLINPPPQRSFSSMAYDATHMQLILFGGSNFGPPLADTFNWNGIAWAQLSPATSPPARSDAMMAYDPTNNGLILFGGFGGSGVLDDTWKWNGTNWTQLTPANSPPARSDASLAFDPATNQLILFGGYNSSGFPLNDTWKWNGTTWTQLVPSTSPPARGNACMAFDTATNLLILFGGFGNSGDLNDTWSWNGITWTQLFPATSPPTRSDAVMAFDPGTNQLILFGGDGEQDTWSWDGGTWEELFPSNFPVFSNGTSMAFDYATNQLILLDTVSNTWNWDSFPPFFAVATPSNQSICSETTTDIAISANVSGATFSWTASAVGVSGASNGSGPLIAQTLSITGTSPGRVTYTITPTSPSGCQGTPITVVVTVNLLPFAAATPPSQSIPSGGTANIVLSSNVPGTTFSWNFISNGVSGASNGSGSLISQTLSTTTSSTGTVIYTITPTSPTGCTGSTLIAVVTVGSSSSEILPPTKVKGCHKRCYRFRVNIITWHPPKGGETPVSYIIYRDAILTEIAAVIPANQTLKFKDSCSYSRLTHTYYIVSVDSSGNQSVPVSVSVNKKCHRFAENG